MPCRDYMDDRGPDPEVSALKSRLDTLSRIACNALEELEKYKDGGLEALVLKDPEVAEWWSAHKEADRKAKEEAAIKRKKAADARELNRKREEIKAKLSPAELKILGLK